MIMKKILTLILCLVFTINCAQASFKEHYDAGQIYLGQYQYSSAISEFKKALRINYMDNSARIGLVNSYLARGTFYANTDKNYEAAANDFRAALFYLKYYPDDKEVQRSIGSIENTQKNLAKCLAAINAENSPDARYKMGQKLRLKGQFAEAGYEFAQSFDSQRYRASAYEQIGDIMKILGNVEKVPYYYKKAVDINGNIADLRLKYARALDKQGLNDQALKEYNYALSSGDDDPETLYALERIYRQKLLQNENDATSLSNLGAILQKQNKLDEALKYYVMSDRIDPENVTNRLNMGTLYQQKKNYDAAITIYDSILVLHPNNLNVNLYKAQCLALKGDIDSAKTAFKQVLYLSPNESVKSEIFNTLKNYMPLDDLVTFVYGPSSPKKQDLENIYDDAVAFHKNGKIDKAIEYYKEVLKYDKQNPEVYINLAIAYNQNKDFASAKSILNEAMSKYPNNKQLKDVLASVNDESNGEVIGKALSLYNSQNYQQAISVYSSIQPQTFDSLVGIATCYKALDKDDAAIEYYKKALNLKQNSDVAYYLGILYADKQDYANAKTYLNLAVKLNPSNNDAKEFLAEVTQNGDSALLEEGIDYYGLNNYEKALSIFNRVLQSSPTNAYALYYRGLIYDNQKKYSLAVADYLKAVKLNPELKIAYYLAAVDYDSLSQYKNALINYRKYVSVTTESNEYKTYAQSRINALKKYE